MADDHIIRISISASDSGVSRTLAAIAAKIAALRLAARDSTRELSGLEKGILSVDRGAGKLAGSLLRIPWGIVSNGAKAFTSVLSTAGAMISKVTVLGLALSAAIAGAVAVLQNATFVLAGGFIAAIGQALPVLGLLVAAFKRVGAAAAASAAETKAHADQLKNATEIAHDHAEALYAIAQAQQAVLDATKRLTDARREATRGLQDLVAAEKAALLQQQEAAFGLTRAQQGLRRANRDGDVNSIFEAQFAVADAAQGASGARTSAARAAEDLNRAQAKGVEGADAVVAAKRAIASASHALAEAEYQAAEQSKKLRQQLTDAYAGLDPVERKLADSIGKLRETAKRVFRPITDEILKPITKAVDQLTDLLNDPKIQRALLGLAKQIGVSIGRISDFLFSPASRDAYIVPLLDAATKNLPEVTTILLGIAKAFAEVGKAFDRAITGEHGLLRAFRGQVDNFNKLFATETAKGALDEPANGRGGGRRKQADSALSSVIDDGLRQLTALGSLLGSVINLTRALAELFNAGGLQKGGGIQGLADAINGLAEGIRKANKDGKFDHFFKVLGQILNDIETVSGRIAEVATVLKGIFKDLGFSDGGAILATGVFSLAVLKLLDGIGKSIAGGIVSAIWRWLSKSPGPGGGGGAPTTGTPTSEPSPNSRPAGRPGEPVARPNPEGKPGPISEPGGSGRGGRPSPVETGTGGSKVGGTLFTIGVAILASKAQLPWEKDPEGELFDQLIARAKAKFESDKKDIAGAGAKARQEDGTGITQQEQQAETDRETRRAKEVFTGANSAANAALDRAIEASTGIQQAARNTISWVQNIFGTGEDQTRISLLGFNTQIASDTRSSGLPSAWSSLWDKIKTTQDTAQTQSLTAFEQWVKAVVDFINSGGIQQAADNLWSGLTSSAPHGGGGGSSGAPPSSGFGGGGGGGGARFGADAQGHPTGIATGSFLPSPGQDDASAPGTELDKWRRRVTSGAINAASALDAANWPYAWGGGHNPSATPSLAFDHPNAVSGKYEVGYDCSGSVWAVLKAAGITEFTGSSDDMVGQGLPARGDEAIVVHTRGGPHGHVWLTLNGQNFSTGSQHYLNGPGFGYDGNPGDYVTRKPHGFKTGGMVGGDFDGADDISINVSRGEAILNPRQIAMLGRNRVMGVLRRTGGKMLGAFGRYARGAFPPPVKHPPGDWDNPDPDPPDAPIRFHRAPKRVMTALLSAFDDFGTDLGKLVKLAKDKGKGANEKLKSALSNLGDALTAIGEEITAASQRASTRLTGSQFAISRRGGRFVIRQRLTDDQVAVGQEKLDETDRTRLLREQADANKALRDINKQIKATKDPKRKAILEAAKKGLENQAQTVIDALAENAAKLGEDAQAIQGAAFQVTTAAADRRNASTERLRRLRTARGQHGDNADLFARTADTIEDEQKDLRRQLKAARKSGNSELAKQIRDKLGELDADLADNTRARIQAGIDEVNRKATTGIASKESDRRLAELGYRVDSQGNLIQTTSGGPDVAGERTALLGERGLLDQKRVGLVGQLADAQAAHNTDLIQALQQDLKDNALAIAENTEQMKKLGQQELQAFTSTSWQLFRTAVFNGLGGLLPQFQVPALDTGGDITSTGFALVHAGEKVVAAGVNRSGDTSNTEMHQHFEINNVQGPLDVDALMARAAWEQKVNGL